MASRTDRILARLDLRSFLPFQQGENRSLTIVYLLLMGLFIVIIAIPLAFLIWGSVWSTGPFTAGGHFTVENYVETFLAAETYELFVNTLIIAIGTTIWANVLGIGIAWTIARTNMPYRKFFESVIVLPYVVPSYLLAVAYIFLLSPRIGSINRLTGEMLGVTLNIYSFWGIIFVKGISYAPLCFLITVGAFKNFDPSLEDASRMSGAGVFRTLRSVTLPMLLPAVSASFLLIFTKGLETFSVPAFLGLPASPPIVVFSTRIYQALASSVPPNYALGTALSTILIVFGVAGLMVQRRVTSRQEKFTTIRGQGFNPRRYDLGRFRWVFFAGLVLLLLVSIIIPFLTLFVASVSSIWFGEFFFASETVSFTLQNYIDLVRLPGFFKALRNSFFLAVVGGFLGMLFASLSSYFVVKIDEEESRFISSTSEFMDQLSYMPTAVPGIVLAVGFLWFVLTIPSFGLYGSLWLLLLAYIARQMPEATRTTHGAISQVGDELEDQARIAGAGWLQTMKDIIFPVISKNFAAGFLLLFMSMIRDLSTSILLYNPENSIVLAVMIFNLKLVGNYEALAALSIVLMAIVLSVVLLVEYGLGVSLTE